MTSDYDPRRSRRRPHVADDVEPAPVEALLGPEPADSPVRSNGSSTAGTSGPPTRPAPLGAAEGAPSRLVQLAPMLVAASVLAAIIWYLTRNRD